MGSGPLGCWVIGLWVGFDCLSSDVGVVSFISDVLFYHQFDHSMLLFLFFTFVRTKSFNEFLDPPLVVCKLSVDFRHRAEAYRTKPFNEFLDPPPTSQ